MGNDFGATSTQKNELDGNIAKNEGQSPPVLNLEIDLI